MTCSQCALLLFVQVMSTVLFVLKLLSISVDDISQALLSVRWREGGGGGTTRRSAVSAGDTAAENGGKVVFNRGWEEGREGKTGSYTALDSIQDRLVRLEQGMGTMQAGINALLDAGKADKFALLPTQPVCLFFCRLCAASCGATGRWSRHAHSVSF